MYSDELTNQFWLKKLEVTGFFVQQFFFTNLLITFWNYLPPVISVIDVGLCNEFDSIQYSFQNE